MLYFARGFGKESKEFVGVAEFGAAFLLRLEPRIPKWPVFKRLRRRQTPFQAVQPIMSLAISEITPQQTMTSIGLLCLMRSTASAMTNSAT